MAPDETVALCGDTPDWAGDSKRLVGRAVGLLFVLIAFLALFIPLLPISTPINRVALALESAAAMALGLAAFFAPWDRWPRSAGIAMFVAGLAFKSTFTIIVHGEVPLEPLGITVLFAWIGISQPRWTSVKLAPLALLSFALPWFFIWDSVPAATRIVTMLVVIPMTIVVAPLIGETIAWQRDKLIELEVGRARADQHLIERQRQALDLNDAVVQDLAVAKLASQLGDSRIAANSLNRALDGAIKIVADLLSEVGPENLVLTTEMAVEDLRDEPEELRDVG